MTAHSAVRVLGGLPMGLQRFNAMLNVRGDDPSVWE